MANSTLLHRYEKEFESVQDVFELQVSDSCPSSKLNFRESYDHATFGYCVIFHDCGLPLATTA